LEHTNTKTPESNIEEFDRSISGLFTEEDETVESHPHSVSAQSLLNIYDSSSYKVRNIVELTQQLQQGIYYFTRHSWTYSKRNAKN